MRRYRRFWGALLAAVMLASIAPAAYAADKDGPSAPGLAALATDPDSTNGLNGKTGSNDNFDYSKYDVVMEIYDMVEEISAEGHWYTPIEDFEWPDDTTILLTVSQNSDK